MINQSRRPSAALVLGVLSGCVAALAVLPTALPLTGRLTAAEEAVSFRQATTAAHLTQRMLTEGTLSPGTRDRVGAEFVRVYSDGLLVHQEGPDLPITAIEGACGDTSTGALAKVNGRPWAMACIATEEAEIVTGVPIVYGSTGKVVLLVVTLAAIVGIVTALGVLRLLTPLSRLSRAIVRVGAGERGVRVPSSGLVELDELAERLNAAARAMEDREETIMARIRAVQEMARMVAHEVRNPLQSLELLTTLIASEEDPKDRLELAQSIHVEIRALDMVVTRILREGAMRGQRLPLHRQRTTLVPLVDHVLTLRQPEARAHGITLERGPVSPIEASIDAALIGRSLENLAINAMQAVAPATGRVRVSVVAEASHVALVVDDNGRGVDPDLADHIFDVNVSGRTGGTGLGLALVREVIEAHGGYIVQDRSPLGGARFTARIPLEDLGGDHAAESTDRR